MGAAPGSPIAVLAPFDLGLPSRRVFGQIGRVIGNPIAALRGLHLKGIGQASIAEFGVMTIGFSIGSRLNDLPLALSSPADTVDHRLAGNEGSLERDAPRDP